MADNENLFQLDSRTMSKQYVYYNRLAQSRSEQNRELYQSAKKTFNNSIKALSDEEMKEKVVNRLRTQSKIERKKEVQLMNKLYNGRYDDEKNWDDPETVKEFIKFFNYSMGLKEVYERNRQLILSGSKSKADYSYYDSYLTSILSSSQTKERIKQLVQDCLDGIQEWSAIDEAIRDVIKEAMVKMINAKSENGTDKSDEAIQKAYQELLAFVQSPPSEILGPDFIDQIEEIYGISDLVANLKQGGEGGFNIFDQAAENIKINGDPLDNSKNYSTNKKTGKKNRYSDKGSHNRYRQQGEMQEVITSLILKIAAKEVRSKNIKIEGGRTGPQGFKADSIYAVGMDAEYSEKVFKAIEQQKNRTREENIAFFSRLDNSMEKIGSGALVYVSSKNYSINSDNFKGFSAGAALKLKSYEQLLLKKQTSPQSAAAAIGAIMQLAQGAIGTENQDKFELLLAKDVAAMLFDDFNIIGTEQQTDAYSVHVMDLNGIFVPISTILSSLADAIEDGTISKVVSAKIEAPDILFKTAKEQGQWQAMNPNLNAWMYQKNDTLDRTKIIYHFLKDFTSLLKSWTES